MRARRAAGARPLSACSPFQGIEAARGHQESWRRLLSSCLILHLPTKRNAGCPCPVFRRLLCEDSSRFLVRLTQMTGPAVDEGTTSW